MQQSSFNRILLALCSLTIFFVYFEDKYKDYKFSRIQNNVHYALCIFTWIFLCFNTYKFIENLGTFLRVIFALITMWPIAMFAGFIVIFTSNIFN